MITRPELDRIVILLSSGIAQRKLYFAGHPKVKGLGQDFVAQLVRFLDESGQDELFIGVVDGKLVYDGRFLVGPSIAGGQLIRFAGLLHGGGFVFGREVTGDEITELLGLAAELQEPVAGLAEGRALLVGRGIENVKVAAEYHDPAGLGLGDQRVVWQGRDQGGSHLDSPVLIYQALYDVVSASHTNAALNQMLDIDSARSVSEYLLHSTRNNFTDIIQLMHYPDYDSYTVGHSVRVAALAVHMGEKLGMVDHELLELGTAGLLHDVGKSKIPDEILFKPGKLDREEFDIMKSHARLGAEILMEHKTATPTDVAAAWGHHLRHDGGGYPEAPAWAAQSHVSALLHVCDVFEALTAVRPYKAPMTPREAYGIMLKDAKAFDPALLHLFITSLGLYPPGNQVRLSDGTTGIVIAPGPEIDRPTVKVLLDADRKPLAEADRVELATDGENGTGVRVEELLLAGEPALT